MLFSQSRRKGFRGVPAAGPAGAGLGTHGDAGCGRWAPRCATTALGAARAPGTAVRAPRPPPPVPRLLSLLQSRGGPFKFP